MATVNIMYFVMGVVFSHTTGTTGTSTSTTDTTENDYDSSNKNTIVGSTLTGIFLGYAILFVPMSYITHVKMNHIFYTFVNEKAWIQAKSEDEDEDERDHEHEHEHNNTSGKEERNSFRHLNFARSVSTGNFSTTALAPVDRVDQKDYFWFSNPSYVVTLGQLMQFG